VQADAVTCTAVTIRTGCEADLPALEWEGQYLHFRQVYRRAMEEALRGLRVVLVAEVEGEVVGQLFIQFRKTELAGRRAGATATCMPFAFGPRIAISASAPGWWQKPNRSCVRAAAPGP